MIADDIIALSIGSGSLQAGAIVHKTSFLKLVEFIAQELPKWRDRARQGKTAHETKLAAQLCAHLLSAARHNRWDFIQFRREEPDEHAGSRTIDMVAAPSGCVVWVDGLKYEDFDPLLPIECKRLPTPSGKKRDKREYLYSAHASTGGVERFKIGHHASGHSRAVMIGFIQAGTVTYWDGKLKLWVAALAREGKRGWTVQDTLSIKSNDATLQVGWLDSVHSRRDLPDISLNHLWIEMN